MKKILFLAIFSGLLIGVVLAKGNDVQGVPVPFVTAPTLTPTPTPTPTPVPVGIPVDLAIPAIGMKAPVDPVGLDASGRMDVPTAWERVAWYERGPKPGENGNSVLAAHYDTPWGAGIFYRLRNVTAGDLVEVTGADRQIRQFEVIRTESFSDASFPIETVFGKAEGSNLNLITCQGIFNAASQNYSHRLVVFTRLIE